MKVAESAQDGRLRNMPEPVRNLSVENRGATASPATMTDTPPFDKDRLKDAMRAAENLSQMSNRRLKFEYHEEADVFQVSVMDDDDEVVRKIPADNILRMIANIEKMLGLSIDTKA